MAAKHGNGSIVALEKTRDGRKKDRSKCRKWRLVVSLGRDPRSKDARYRQKSRNFQGTYGEAQQELRKFMEEVENGEVVTRTAWTYNDYADHFVKAREASGKFSERTIETDRYTLGSLGRLIGNVKLQDITPQILEAAYSDLRTGSNGIARPIGGTRLFNINRTVFIMFEDARRKGILSANPLYQVDKPKKDTKPKTALSSEDYRAILLALDPEEHRECAVLLCAALGLRRSESLALSWGDVNFADNVVVIHSSLTEDCKLKEPKTESGYRTLPLADHLAEKLMRRKAAQVAQLLKNEPKFVVELNIEDGKAKPAGAVEIEGNCYDLKPETPVVCDEFAARVRPHTFSVWWTQNRARFGLENCTLHGLRHSFLSAAAANGVHPAVMQELAGHKSAETTMEIYTHVNMVSKRDAMEVLQAAYM